MSWLDPESSFHIFHYITTYCFFYIHTILGGSVWNHCDQMCLSNESLDDGDEWSMEVDLRSDEKEKRTLHWFVRRKQQKRFIKGVPDRVEFGV